MVCAMKSQAIRLCYDFLRGKHVNNFNNVD